MPSEVHEDQIMKMTIDGHEITIRFAKNYNPTISALVRTTLLDAFIRKNNLSLENS